jgi:uncharacterized protein (TIGR02145 family)
MNFFNVWKLGRTLLLLTAVAAVGLLGCGDNPTDSGGNPRIAYGTLNDSRDGKSYKTVTIGGTKWMAENLNYQTDSSFCYNHDNSMCSKYGRLYQWNKAMSVCPSGWRLPTQQEWRDLIAAAGGEDEAGKNLITETGWSAVMGEGTPIGTNRYGFSALPGGAGVMSSLLFEGGAGNFIVEGFAGYWWSATEKSTNSYFNTIIVGAGENVGVNTNASNNHVTIYSVRCIQN